MSHRVVSAEWLSAHLGDPRVRIVVAAPNARLFSIGQIPGAVRLDCSRLFDVSRGDFVDGPTFAAILGELGIRRTDTVVVYGDRDNSAAALALWLFAMVDHANVALLDGGRSAWVADDRETEFASAKPAPSDYPAIPRDDAPHRISRAALHELISSSTILDTRSPADYAGTPDGEIRSGHVPSAINLPASTLRNASGRFLDADALEARLAGIPTHRPVIVYDRSAARAAEMWLVLRFLMDWNDVRVYDGGWNEWGNSFGVPVVQGSQH